jgi:hypothetical protein
MISGWSLASVAARSKGHAHRTHGMVSSRSSPCFTRNVCALSCTLEYIDYILYTESEEDYADALALHEDHPDDVERPPPPIRYHAIDTLRLPDSCVWYKSLDEGDKAMCRAHIVAIREANDASISSASLASGDITRTQRHVDNVVRTFMSFKVYLTLFLLQLYRGYLRTKMAGIVFTSKTTPDLTSLPFISCTPNAHDFLMKITRRSLTQLAHEFEQHVTQKAARVGKWPSPSHSFTVWDTNRSSSRCDHREG